MGGTRVSAIDTLDLAPGVDYLWCKVCQVHVECIRTASGWWEVQCPQCVGECSLCRCHLREFCFGVREGTPPLKPDAEAPECPYWPDEPYPGPSGTGPGRQSSRE